MALPNGYTRLEYIESTGTQYIDTGFRPNQDTRIVAKLSFDVVSSGTSVYVFGAANSGSSGMFEVSTGSGQIRLGYGSNAVTEPFPSSKPFEVDFNKNVIKVDGTDYTMAASTFSVSYSVYIFNTNRNGAYRAASKVAVYAFKIYNNGTLVHDFTPCKNASGVAGMWDNVNNSFYQNAGTGTFVTGPEIHEGGIFVKVNGVWKQVDNITVNVN